MSGFDRKRLFLRELLKIWQIALFNPQWRKNSFQEEFYSISGFDGKPIFQREMVKILKNAVFNPQWSKTQFSRVILHDWIWCKTHFQREMVKTCQNALTNPQWSKTVFKKEFYSMTGFGAKPIFQRELVIMWRNAVFNSPWRKTQFSRKSVISWVDSMQNTFFREKWKKFDKTLFLTQNGAKHRI